jgi:hypothetical protein
MLGAYSIGLDQRLLEATPQHLRGRTLSLATSGLMLANGLGFAAAGAAAEFATPTPSSSPAASPASWRSPSSPVPSPGAFGSRRLGNIKPDQG